jgi:SAM-dependent methyltransferase
VAHSAAPQWGKRRNERLCRVPKPQRGEGGVRIVRSSIPARYTPMRSTPDTPAAPSDWVRRFAALIVPGATVLDYACGSGRHARWLAECGARVTAVDRDPSALDTLRDFAGVRARRLELEEADWPLVGEAFDAVVVTNYLYRPRLQALFDLVRPGGVLIYETFMLGNERFGKPSNPDFLLRPGELATSLPAGWSVVAFEQGEVATPRPAMIQRLCAIRAGQPVRLPA